SGSMRSPSSVNCACGRSRLDRSPPSSPSSCLMARVREGWETLHFSDRLGEIELADGGQEISHLMHFHGGDLQRVSQSAFSSFDPARALSGRALRNAEILMVGATGIEPVTPTMSR